MRQNIRQTFIQEVAKGSGNTENVVESSYTPADGTSVNIEHFFGSIESSFKQSRIELVVRDGSDSMVFAALVTGNVFHVPVRMSVAGNGSKSIVIRLINADPTPIWMFGGWDGVSHDG